MIENSEDSFGNFAGEEKESDNVLKDIEVLACFISQDREGNNNPTLFLPQFPSGVFFVFVFFRGTRRNEDPRELNKVGCIMLHLSIKI